MPGGQLGSCNLMRPSVVVIVMLIGVVLVLVEAGWGAWRGRPVRVAHLASASGGAAAAGWTLAQQSSDSEPVGWMFFVVFVLSVALLLARKSNNDTGRKDE